MKKFEVAIVGAGPAGSTAAYVLSQNGVDTLLLEKKDMPRKKTCGGAFTKRTLDLNERVFGKRFTKHKNAINSNTKKFRVKFNKNRITSFHSTKTVFFCDRAKYDYCLFKEALEAGSSSITGDAAQSIDFDRKILLTQSNEKIKYDYLFAADGANSTVRRSLLNSKKVNLNSSSNQMAIGLEVYLDRNQAPKQLKNTNIIELTLGIINWGYGWVLPHEEQLLIGIGGLPTKNKNIRSNFEDYCSSLGVDIDKHYINGHPFPLGNYMKTPCYKNVLFLGDAAGFADPLTGEGIYYAQRSGEIAAHSLINQNSKSNNYRYQEMVQKDILQNFTGIRRLRSFIYAGPRKPRYLLLKTLTKLLNPKIVKDLAINAPFNWSLFG